MGTLIKILSTLLPILTQVLKILKTYARAKRMAMI